MQRGFIWCISILDLGHEWLNLVQKCSQIGVIPDKVPLSIECNKSDMKKLEQFIIDQFFTIIAGMSAFWLSLIVYGIMHAE